MFILVVLTHISVYVYANFF